MSGSEWNAGFTAEGDASGLSDVNAWSEPEQEPSISDVQAGDAVEEGAGDVRTQGLSEESGSEASGSVKIGPEQAWGQQFPALPFSFYATALDPEMQAALADWLEAHPEVDLSVMEAFEEAASAKRSTFPARLTLEEREQMAAWMERFESLKLEMVRVRAEVFDLAVSGVEASGRGFFLEGFTREGQARYTFTSNREAAISTGASFVRRSEAFDAIYGPGIDGSGLYVNVNDSGMIHPHVEFNNPQGETRLRFIHESTSGSREHMTHVAGTIGAMGVQERAMGMAPGVLLRALVQQSTTDITRFGMGWPGEPGRSVVGNTSLGADGCAGQYTWISMAFDETLHDYPYYLHFYAAGNNGRFHSLDMNRNVAKNVIMVGAVDDAQRDESGALTGGAGLASFSSQGPALDGRIKPDLVANGVSVYSPRTATGYRSRSGTSMASPNAAGSAVLLIDYYRKRFPGQFLRSSTWRALILNTTDDLGTPGPNYRFGFGLMNVYAAAKTVRQYADDPASRVLREDRLVQGDMMSYEYDYAGEGPIRLTLAWIEPTGTAADCGITTRSLVNDLNLRLIGPDGTVHYPYVMPYTVGTAQHAAFSSQLYDAAAVTGVNDRDNVNQIFVASPLPGTYRVEVDHTGNLHGGFQDFSLAFSGLVATSAAPPLITGVSEPFMTPIYHDFRIEGANFVIGSEVQFERHGEVPVPLRALRIVGNEILGRIDTREMEPGYWDMRVRLPEGSEAVYRNALMVRYRPVAYHWDFDTDPGFTLEGDWGWAEPARQNPGPWEAYRGTRILSSHPSGSHPENPPIASATSPVFDLSDADHVYLYYKSWHGTNSSFWQTARFEWSTHGNNWSGRMLNPVVLMQNSWHPVSENMTQMAGSANVQFRFLFGATQQSSTQTHIGLNVDDLSLIGVSASHAPKIISEPVPWVNANQIYVYGLIASDADTPSADLVLAAEGLPDWLSLIHTGDGTARLEGVPGADDVGPVEIAVSVSDGVMTSWHTFTLVVYPEDTVPGLPMISLAPIGEVGLDQAVLRAEMLGGQAPISLWVWLGTSDGGSVASAWDRTEEWGTVQLGTVEALVTGLQQDTQYFYRLVANNAAGEAQTETGQFTSLKEVIVIEPRITLMRPTLSSVRIPESVGLVLETEVSETGGTTGQMTLQWEQISGDGTVTWDTTDQENTAAWFSAKGNYVLRLTADNGENSDVLEISVHVVDPEEEGVGPSWTAQDIGSGISTTGVTTFANGAYTLSVDSGDIWGSSDSFHYAWQEISGDWTIEAEINWLVDNPYQFAKSGLMIRETLNANSKFAMAMFSGLNSGVMRPRLLRRSETGGTVSGEWGSDNYNWVRLVRSGNNFSLYESLDGESWSHVGTQSVTMAEDVYVGLALSSHQNGPWTQVQFSNVEGFGGGGNVGPLVIAGESRTVDLSQTVVLSGTVEDDGLPEIPGVVTTEWLQMDGPPAVNFDHMESVETGVTFPQTGVYTLRLTAFDGEIKTAHDKVVTVQDALEAPDVSEWPTAGGLVYGQTLGESTLSGGAASVPGTFAFVNPDTMPIAGTTLHPLRFMPEDSGTYAAVISEVSVAVSPASVTVRANDVSKFAGQSDPEFTWTLTAGEFVGGDTLSGALEREAGEDVGTYAILQGTLTAGPNYDLTFLPGILTIEASIIQRLSFAANGGIGELPEEADYEAGSTVVVPGSGDLSKAGFVFNGWRDVWGAVTVQPGESFTMPGRDVTLVAQWTVASGEPEEVLQFNFGAAEYTGTNSPGHAAGGIPNDFESWTRVNGNDIEFSPGRFVRFRRANGSDLNDGVTLSQTASTGNRSTDTGTGIFATALGQNWRAYVRGGNAGRNVGAWFEGLPHGEWTVYAVVHNPVLIASGRTTHVGIGTGSQTTGDLAWNNAILTQTSFAASPQTVTWEEGVNYAKTTVTVDAQNPILYVLQGGPAAQNDEFDYHTLTSIQLVRGTEGPGEGFTVTYTANGGDGTVPEDLNQYAPEQEITVMGQGAVFREGYVFAGWRDENADITYQPLDSFTMPERDVLLTAQWTAVSTAPSFEDWLTENNLDVNLPPEALEESTGLSYQTLFVMGATLNGSGGWQGILRTEAPVPDSNGGMLFRFSAQSGRRYTLEHTENLTDPQWLEVQDIDVVNQGDETSLRIQLPPFPRAFYRIRVELEAGSP